jgi:aryl-alcohol dehydrogenase-like predicted oxidoreductase
MQTEFRPESVALAQQVVERARRRGVTPTAFALGWVWNNRLVHGVIAGPKTLEQWHDYVAAWGQPFSAEDEAFVSGLVAAGHSSTPHYTDPAYPVTGREPKTGG